MAQVTLFIIYGGLSPLMTSFKTQKEWLQDGGRAQNAQPATGRHAEQVTSPAAGLGAC